MPTDCIPTLFDFAPVEGRRVVTNFDGGTITSDAGALLLGATDKVLGLTRRLAACFKDHRDRDLIEHRVETPLTQRITAIALGYEDLIDHDQLRHDPIMAVLAGKLAASRSDCAPVAGKSTLNRLELSKAEPTRYARIAADRAAIEALFVDLFLDAHDEPPAEIVLDLDATDDPLHGHQEGRFFHGYYDSYCYLPLYIFCGRHLLVAKLRPANIDACAGALEETIRLVARIRTRWPKTRIVLRADSGFCRDNLMTWAEGNDVDYLFGLARNTRLVAEIGAELQQARLEAEATGKPARRFKELRWTTRKSWSRERRVVGKAEWTQGEANPRFVVTSLPVEKIGARRLYEEVYCARGEMENRIKECQRPVRRPHLGGDDGGQPVAPVVLRLRLCAGVCAAQDRLGADTVRSRELRHDPAEAAEDRRAGAHQCPPRGVRHGLGLPVAGGVRAGACGAATSRRLRRHEPDSAQVTSSMPTLPSGWWRVAFARRTLIGAERRPPQRRGAEQHVVHCDSRFTARPVRNAG
jgi:Transposase DDE domain group 1